MLERKAAKGKDWEDLVQEYKEKAQRSSSGDIVVQLSGSTSDDLKNQTNLNPKSNEPRHLVEFIFKPGAREKKVEMFL